MLQTALTNFRTLSFAFVMVAMLMVGVMAPVHEASAQEAGPSERAAMMEQINMLMGLIVQLMSQLQVMQTQGVISEIESEKLPVIFTHPSKRQYEAGGTLDVKWTEGDGWFTGLKIENLKTGKVSFFRDALSADRLYELRAPTEPGEYRLIAYNYRGISDSADYLEYGVSRPFTVIVDQDTKAQEDLQRVLDELNSIGNKDTDDLEEDIEDLYEELEEYEDRYDDVYQEAREYDLDDVIEELLEEVDSYLEEAVEQYEDEDYSLVEDNLEEAEDLLDELNDILDDLEDGRYTQVVAVNVCPYTWTRTLKVGDTGADVKILQQFLNTNSDTRVALSGRGSAGNENTVFDRATADAVSKFQVKYRSEVLSPLGLVNPTGELDASTRAKLNNVCVYSKTDDTNPVLQEQIDHLLKLIDNPSNSPSDSKRKSASEQELQAMINNLMQQIAQQQQETELVGDTESRDFWDIEYPTHVYAVGAYEGSYPDGDQHSFRYHPQGEVTLNMNKRSGQSEDTMLILTSYEPVNWKLTGDATEYVTRVFLSGYYDQEITGIGSDVEVVHMSHQSGDREYFYAYDEGSANFRDLREYVEDQSDEEIYLYWASDYSLSTVNLGQKG
jgi:peptidoglycan hydrolase-like protein with peptidoglycan-binding domain